jgi:hypothetical protein
LGFSIAAETKGSVLTSPLLMNDALKISNVLQTNQGTYADETRSALYLERTKNFPLNSEFETTLTFVNKSGKSGRYVMM